MCKSEAKTRHLYDGNVYQNTITSYTKDCKFEELILLIKRGEDFQYTELLDKTKSKTAPNM